MKSISYGFGNIHQMATGGGCRKVYLPRARRSCLLGHRRIRKADARGVNGQSGISKS